MNQEELINAFESGRLRAREFPHPAHVRVAWGLAQRHEPAEAYRRLSAGIRSIATRAGKPDKFHETITRAWFALIAQVDDLAEHPELFDPRLLSQYYSPARLAAGRERWLEPDLRALGLPTSELSETTRRQTATPVGSARRSAGR